MSIEPGAERSYARRLSVRKISQLSRIALQIVQLGLRRQDVLPPAVADASQIAPPVVDARRQRFRKRGHVVEALAPQRGSKVPSGDARCTRNRYAGEIQDSRVEIDALSRRAYSRARHDPGTAQDKRHPDRGVVEKKAVHRLAVFAERLAVVCSHDGHRLVAQSQAGERGVEPADKIIGPRDFAVVRAIRVSRRVRFGCFVRGVRIVQMDPRERALRCVVLEPPDSVGDGHVAAFLENVEETRFVVGAGAEIELVRERVEAAAQA